MLASASLPVLICLLLSTVRASLANTNVALLLVLVVVAAASTGLRLAGLVAAVASALSFDFFITAPVHQLTIADRSDVETAVLLILVGVAVTEIALWGRRQQARASSEHGYLDGILATVSSAATGGVDGQELAGVVAGQLRRVLDVDGCVFTLDVRISALARLDRDGQVSRNDRPLDVERYGLPTDAEIELLVERGGMIHGRYLLTSATAVRRPTLEQRRVAAALADQVAAALFVQGQPNRPG